MISHICGLYRAILHSLIPTIPHRDHVLAAVLPPSPPACSTIRFGEPVESQSSAFLCSQMCSEL